MRRMIGSSALFLIGALVLPAPVAGVGPASTTYISVGCWVGWDDPYWRTTGLDGQVEHDGAVITYELWVHDASGWRSVGTEVDSVMDESNARTGGSLFRGSFAVTSTLGDFTGSFVWQNRSSGGWGHGVGRASDGSGLLWKATPGVVDPTATGVPPCATDREVYNLTLIELTAP